MIVLDSHIWFWWISGETERYGEAMRKAIEAATRVGVSPVSCYELALAHERNRLELPVPPKEWFSHALHGSNIELLPMTTGIAASAVSLSPVHRDPFDRVIIATALSHQAKLASVDSTFRHYPELDGVLL